MSTLLASLRPARGGHTENAPLSPRAWRSSVVGLHLTFVLLLSLAVGFILLGLTNGPNHGWGLGALVVLAGAYAFAGAPAIADNSDVRAVVYLTVLVLAMGVISWSVPDLLFLLFLAYPQVWFLVEGPRPGIVWTGLLALSSGIGLTVTSVQNGDSSAGAWSSTIVGLLFSVLMGTWVSRVLAQSRQRADLIQQLEATRAELATAHHAQGVTAERERLAREVHDTLAQGYTSIVMLAQTALTQLDTTPEHARDRLELIEEVARENLREARRVVAAFSPPSLDGSTLVEAIRRLVERFLRETGVQASFDAPEVLGGIARDGEVVVLRAAQEALNNVRRHAHASMVTVRLRLTDDGSLQLMVRDDGVGFDPTAAAGNGLAGMRARVDQSQGSVRVDSGPGLGTTVLVDLPVALVPQ